MRGALNRDSVLVVHFKNYCIKRTAARRQHIESIAGEKSVSLDNQRLVFIRAFTGADKILMAYITSVRGVLPRLATEVKACRICTVTDFVKLLSYFWCHVIILFAAAGVEISYGVTVGVCDNRSIISRLRSSLYFQT